MLSVTVCDVWGTRVKSAPLVVGVDYRGTGFIQADIPARYLPHGPHVALSEVFSTAVHFTESRKRHATLLITVKSLYTIFFIYL